MPTQRCERVGRQILQEVSTLVERDLADPRLDLVTFTGVRMSPDLRVAWIHYSCMPGPTPDGADDAHGADAGDDDGDGPAGREAAQEAQEALDHAAGRLKREVGRRLRLRYVPDLRFRYDDSLDRSDRISKLLERSRGDR